MVWFSATRSDRRRGVPSCLMVSRTTIFDGRLLVRRRTIVRNHGNPRVRATRALAATAAAARQENCVGRTGTTIDRSRWRFVGQLLSGSCRVNTPPALPPPLSRPLRCAGGQLKGAPGSASCEDGRKRVCGPRQRGGGRRGCSPDRSGRLFLAVPPAGSLHAAPHQSTTNQSVPVHHARRDQPPRGEPGASYST
jgi:hypothetical protein